MARHRMCSSVLFINVGQLILISQLFSVVSKYKTLLSLAEWKRVVHKVFSFNSG